MENQPGAAELSSTPNTTGVCVVEMSSLLGRTFHWVRLVELCFGLRNFVLAEWKGPRCRTWVPAVMGFQDDQDLSLWRSGQHSPKSCSSSRHEEESSEMCGFHSPETQTHFR